MRNIIIILLATCLLAEGSVNVTVDHRRINEGDSITLTVSVIKVSGNPEIKLPNNLRKDEMRSGVCWSIA